MATKLTRKRSNAVTRPNLGLYLDRASIDVPDRGLINGFNFRVKNGRLTNANIGYLAWNSIDLEGPVMLIDLFRKRDATTTLILGSRKDLFQWNDSTSVLSYITPIYNTGTIEVAAGTLSTVTGSSTLWNANLKAGDEISFGANNRVLPTDTWSVILTVDSDTQLTLTANATAQTAGTAYTGRKLYTGAKTDFWSSETFLNAAANEDRWYATNNGVDEVQRWDGSAAQVTDLGSTLDFKCKVLRRYKNMLLYGNLTLDASSEERPTSIRNSAISAPENVSTLEAAETVVHDGAGFIVAMEELGDNLMVYSTDPGPQVLVQFVGLPLQFVFRTVLERLAPRSRRAIANFGTFHEFLAKEKNVRWDGVQDSEISPQIWREILRQSDPERVVFFASHFLEQEAELLWLTPRTTDATGSTSQPETIFTEHYLEQVGLRDPIPYSARTAPFLSFGTFQQASAKRFSDFTEKFDEVHRKWDDQFFAAEFPISLVGDEDGKIYQLDGASTSDGTGVNSFVRFGRRVGVDGRAKALVARIYAFFERQPGASYTLDVTLFSSDQVDGDLTDEGTLAYDLTQVDKNRFVSPFKTVRFFEVEFRTNGVDRVWTTNGYDADLRPGGEA